MVSLRSLVFPSLVTSKFWSGERDQTVLPVRQMLDADVLCLIVGTFPLAELVHLKFVGKSWASAVRRTVCSAPWQSVPANRTMLSSVPPRFRAYSSAEAAFACFDAAPRVEKRLVKQKCKQVAAVHGITLRQTNGQNVAWALFKNKAITDGILTKSIKVLQKRDSDRVFILSDVYDACADRLNEFACRTAIGGVDIFPFELTYPATGRFSPPATVTMLGEGYKYFYRGRIAGFMV